MAREENASYEGKGQRGLSRAGLINTIYPVGSIYMSINPTNPSEYFGGSWTLFAPGRTLVCVDTSQAEFNVVEKPGGSKTINLNHKHATANHALTTEEMPSHSHVGVTTHNENNSASGQGFSANDTHRGFQTTDRGGQNTMWGSISYTGSNWGHNHGNTGANLSSAQSILQPYMTCYMWKRTA